MPFKHIKKFLVGPAPRILREDAMKVFRRDHFKCQYCGLDGQDALENWLVLTIDHVHPHAHGGTRRMDNLVTACRPCNLMKGKRIFATFDDAKKFVLGKREEWRHQFKQQVRSSGA